MSTATIGEVFMLSVLLIGWAGVWGYGLVVLFHGLFGGFDDELPREDTRDYSEDNRTDFR